MKLRKLMGKKLILVVEDDDALRKVITDSLRASGYKVVVEANGSDAFITAVNKEPDLILLDLMLPGSDGISVLEGLRNHNEWAKKVPVIVYTNLMPDEKILADIRRLDAADLFEKVNFRVEHLIGKVADVLKK